jgi:uncharacterized protein (TIGR03083 family)
MSLDRVAAVKAERSALLAFLRTLSPQDWETPSRAEGWSVKDVVAHMGAAAHGFFTPWVVGLIASKDVEAHNDRDAEKRRSWEPAKVLKEYERWSKRAGVAHALLQKPGVRSLPIKLAEVGTYPAHLLTSAIVFDTHLHLRHDIATAVGREVAPSDPNRLAVTLEWMLAGLSPMTRDALAWLDDTVVIDLVGPGGGTWTVAPGKNGRVKVTSGGTADSALTVEADASAFPVWATRRAPWREADLVLKGDEELGERFLDDLRII